MKITKLILKHFKPFLLNSFTHFEYTPKLHYQLITGVNGCGKSSLLRELSPLPSSGDLFAKGGRKEIHIQHNNHEYILINDYTQSKTGKHYFFVDNIDLNDSNNITNQKHLVEQHFNYDQELHSLLIDETRFTDLSPIKRRDWFVRLANCNMEYAINVFNKIKSATRDTLGGIRTTEQHLVEKTSSLLPEEQLAHLKQQMSEYLTSIQELEQFIPKQLPEFNTLQHQFERVVKQIEEAHQALDKTTTPDWVERQSSLDELKTKLLLLSHQVDSLTTELTELTDKFNQLDAQVDKATWEDGLTDEELEIQFKQQETLYNQQKGNILDEYRHIPDILTVIDSVTSEYYEWSTHAPVNPEGEYNRTRYHEKNQLLQQHQQRLLQLKQKQADMLHRLEHIQQHPTTECPQCHHVWKAGINVMEEPELKEKLDKIATVIKQLEENDIADLQAWLRYAEQVRDDRLYFREHFMTRYPQLQPFWSSLLDNVDFTYNPSKYTQNLLFLRTKVMSHLEAISSEKRFQELSEAYTKRLRQKGNQVLVGSLNILREDIEKKNAIQVELIRERKLIERSLRFREETDEKLTHYQSLVTEYRTVMQTIEELTAVTALSEVRDEIYLELAQVRKQLDESDMQMNVVNQLKSQIAFLKQRHEHYQKLIAVLNPQDGLIAKSLLGFIKSFISQLNTIISHVWTYPMQVELDEESDFTSDYKFPLDVGGRNTVSDVGLGSRGQQEFINFAFRLLVMKHLNIINYPILADELGSSFNEEHRVNTFNYIKQLVETGQVEQLFLISHNPTTYDIFNIVDRVNIDPDQVRKEGSSIVAFE